MVGDTKIALSGCSASTISPSETNLKYSFRNMSKSKRSCLLNGVPRRRNSHAQKRKHSYRAVFSLFENMLQKSKKWPISSFVAHLSNNILLFYITSFLGRYKVLYCLCLCLESLESFFYSRYSTVGYHNGYEDCLMIATQYMLLVLVIPIFIYNQLSNVSHWKCRKCSR